jgi:hypothetical protein
MVEWRQRRKSAMTLALEISPELAETLRAIAAREGVAPDRYVLDMLQERLDRERNLPPRLPRRESELLQRINEGLPESTWARYEVLKGKRDAETLTEAEHQELIRLVDEVEGWNVRRLEWVAELAKLRGVRFQDLVRERWASARHRMPERLPTARERRLVEERANGRCEYCLSPLAYSPDPFAVEHIVPRSRGGSHRPANLAFSCQGCNSCKYTSTEALDAVSGERVPLYHPRQHRWQDHFARDDDLVTQPQAPIGYNRDGVGQESPPEGERGERHGHGELDH